MAQKEYKKLPGNGTRFEGRRWIAGVHNRCTLWMGNDHLLLICYASFVEEFKRFYFRDIQAITVRRTQTGKIVNLVLGSFAGVFALIALGVSDRVGVGVLLGIAGFFGLIVIIHTLLGPTCVVELKTAVHVEELSSLKRLRNARKALALLLPKIEEAQGKLTAEEMQARTQTMGSVSQMTGELTAPVQLAATAAALKPYSSSVHLWLFGLLLLDFVFNALHIFVHPVPVLVLETFVSIAVCAVAIAALVKQHQTDLPAGLRRVTWAALIYIGTTYGMAFIQNFAFAIDKPELQGNQWAVFEYLAEIDPLVSIWLLCILIYCAAASLILGTLGLILLGRFRRQQRIIDQPVVLVDAGVKP